VIDLAASGRDPKSVLVLLRRELILKEHLNRVIAELRSRFDHFLKTGDDSKMPADILATIYSVVCVIGSL
jgi:hypothetical protein